MKEKKYELTNETNEFFGVTMRRIRALKDIPHAFVTVGDLGGWIEGEHNLSQDGDAWVRDNAIVYGKAEVSGNAVVSGNAKVSGNAVVSDNARVFGHTRVSDNAKVAGYAEVYNTARVYGHARVYDNAKVKDNAKVYGDSRVYGNAKVLDYSRVYGNAEVFGNGRVSEYAEVCGGASIFGDAIVTSITDYMTFRNTWSSGRCFTYTRSNKMWWVGCFYGTGEELIRKAYADSEVNGKCYEAIVRAVELIEAAKGK